jgi:predicted ester cyclase
MTGFSDEYATLPDYILGITERIWEGRNIGLIRRYYAPDCVMHTQSGPVRGVEAVVSGTLATLHQFPDRQLMGEDVIWSDDGAGHGLLSSHRIVSTQTHLGDGFFGPPTGRAIVTRAIADCRVVGDVIVEEWLLRDTSAVARQIGLDPLAFGRALGAADRVGGRAPWHLDAWAEVAEGRAAARALIQPDAAALARLWTAMVNDADLSLLRQAHDRAVTFHLPGGQVSHGIEGVDRFLLSYLAALPDARLVVDHAIALQEAGRPKRLALRWRLAGTHLGHGAFGSPSGARVLVLGILHAEMAGPAVQRCWLLTDEVAIHRMIGALCRDGGDASPGASRD